MPTVPCTICSQEDWSTALASGGHHAKYTRGEVRHRSGPFNNSVLACRGLRYSTNRMKDIVRIINLVGTRLTSRNSSRFDMYSDTRACTSTACQCSITLTACLVCYSEDRGGKPAQKLQNGACRVRVS
jgi:hypothetical protein